MKRRKYLLLTADERILKLHIGKVPFYYSKAYEVQKYPESFRKLSHFIRRILYFLLLLLPLILLIITLLLTYATVILYRGKEAATRSADKIISILDLIPKLNEYQPSQINEARKKLIQKAKEEENVPAFLKRAKQYGYVRTVWISVEEDHKLENLEILKKRGFIDEIHKYSTPSALIAFYQREEVLQEQSWLIMSWRGQKGADEFEIKKNIIWIYSDINFEPTSPNIVFSYKKAVAPITYSRITLPFNTLLNEKVVFYFERTHHPVTNQVISKRYFELNKKLSEQGLHLLYLPAFSRLTDPSNSDLSFQFFYNIYRPDLFLKGESLTPQRLFQWSRAIDIEGLTLFLAKHLKIPEVPEPCLIHCIQYTNQLKAAETLTYSIYPLSEENSIEIDIELNEYLKIARLPRNEIYFQFCKAQLSDEDTEGYQADDRFETEEKILNKELRDKIQEIKEGVNNGQMLETLLYIIKQFSEINPKLCESICHQLADASRTLEKVISRIHIDSGHRIYLTDYNMEIEMSALPKTIFIFLLKHPEGVLFKELYLHRKELTRIYCKVSNRTDLAQMEKSILDITDAKSNSINEKCSRIKEAFHSKLNETLAENYIVTGSRRGPKKIMLNRSLIRMDCDY